MLSYSAELCKVRIPDLSKQTRSHQEVWAVPQSPQACLPCSSWLHPHIAATHHAIFRYTKMSTVWLMTTKWKDGDGGVGGGWGGSAPQSPQNHQPPDLMTTKREGKLGGGGGAVTQAACLPWKKVKTEERKNKQKENRAKTMHKEATALLMKKQKERHEIKKTRGNRRPIWRQKKRPRTNTTLTILPILRALLLSPACLALSSELLYFSRRCIRASITVLGASGAWNSFFASAQFTQFT